MTTRTLALTIACTLAAAPAFAQGAEKKTGSRSAMSKSAMTDALMEAEKSLLDNLAKHNASAFFALIAPGAWSVDEMGGMTMDEFKKNWAQLKVESVTPSDMKVVPVDATSGIVTYKLDQKGSFNGEPFQPTVYASTVWVNRSGKWVAVFHQESTPAAKK
jgi:hypothetical protein